jgi:hypothetical protein
MTSLHVITHHDYIVTGCCKDYIEFAYIDATSFLQVNTQINSRKTVCYVRHRMILKVGHINLHVM